MNAYKVNVSSINDFMSCPFRWWAKWVMNYVPKNESPALGFGKVLHTILEKHGTGEATMIQAVADADQYLHYTAAETTDSFERDITLKCIEQLDDLSPALIQWSDQYQFEIPCLEVEIPFEWPDPLFPDQIIYMGRPDRVGVMQNQIWHIQHKGLARSTNFATFIELAKRSYHEHLYAEALSAKYINPVKSDNNWRYGGTLFDLIRKLKYIVRGQPRPLSEMFWQHPMPINLESSLHKHVMECIRRYALEMQNVEYHYRNYNVIPLPNERMNGGYYGNKPDEFFKVLVGEIELGDPRYFKQREDMYASTDCIEDQG